MMRDLSRVARTLAGVSFAAAKLRADQRRDLANEGLAAERFRLLETVADRGELARSEVDRDDNEHDRGR